MAFLEDSISCIVINCTEWLIGKADDKLNSEKNDLVFEGEDLTWDDVALANRH